MTHDELAALIDGMREHPCYMLLALPRTGNTAVWTALRKHPAMHWRGEVWAAESQNRQDHGLTIGERLMKTWGTPRGGFSFTGHVEFGARELRPDLWDTIVPGLKRGHPLFERRERALKDFIWSVIWRLHDHIKVILLDRLDEIGRYVSALHAEQCGIWHIWNGRRQAALSKAKKVKVSLDVLDRHILMRRRQWAQYVEAFPDALQLHYEDLLADRPAFFKRILDYLGLRQLKLTPEVSKFTTPWWDRVVNYQEIRDHFRDRPEFDHCFKEA